jgi:hypothetical protein
MAATHQQQALHARNTATDEAAQQQTQIAGPAYIV